jgi:hypothetical protein
MNLVLFYVVSVLIGIGGATFMLFFGAYLPYQWPLSLFIRSIIACVAGLTAFLTSMWLSILTFASFNLATKDMRFHFWGIWLLIELLAICVLHYRQSRAKRG